MENENNIVGIDLHNVIQDKHTNFDFAYADGTKLPFKDRSFDVVVSFDVIEHIENDLHF